VYFSFILNAVGSRKKGLRNTSSYHMHKQTQQTHKEKCPWYHVLCKYWMRPPAVTVLTLSL